MHTLFPLVIFESAKATLNIIVLYLYFIILFEWVFCQQNMSALCACSANGGQKREGPGSPGAGVRECGYRNSPLIL